MRIDLVAVERGGRWVDSAPDGIRVGALSLHGWEVHPVNALPDVSGGRDCYLVKANYELDLVSTSVGMNWFEAGLTFTTDSAEQVTVVDALPRATHQPVGERTYTLTDWLHLVPPTADAPVRAHLPATTDLIDVFGVGGQQVRWRHLAKTGRDLRAGSDVAWIVVLVPKGSPEVAVEFSARYGFHADNMVRYVPTGMPERFSLRLRERGVGRLAIEPVAVDEGEERNRGVGPRVFISYAQDDDAHIRMAVQFGDLMARLGIDVHMDKAVEGTRQDWYIWAIREILNADFITVLASPKCRAAGDGELPDDVHPGIQTELTIIRDKLHGEREKWTRKVLPVILPGERKENIPAFLLPYSADRYTIDELTEEELEDLLRAMGRSRTGEWPPARPADGDNA